MKGRMLSKGLVVAVILLFVGVAVQPSIATVQPEKIIVESDSDDIEGLVAQLRVAVNEKLEKYESYPKVAGFWDIINHLLDILEKIGLLIAFIPVFYILYLFQFLQ